MPLAAHVSEVFIVEILLNFLGSVAVRITSDDVDETGGFATFLLVQCFVLVPSGDPF